MDLGIEKKKASALMEDKWTHVLLFGKLLINVAQIEHTNDVEHSHRRDHTVSTIDDGIP